ncbi:MAG: ABC transporter permease [Maritimibacter sp.]|nr:ABC transporter permease [Maritimibacter sp.]
MAQAFIKTHGRTLFAWGIFAVLMGIFLSVHPRGATLGVFTTWSNQCAALALLAVGQTIVVLSKGIDLSIGPIMALTNCLASHLVNGSPAEIALGVALVIVAGAACGLVNGLVVVVGKLQAIIATLATGAIFTGLALLVRPIPGGEISIGLSDAFTMDVFGLAPSAVLVMIGAVALWYPIRRHPIGRSIIAVGSSEAAAEASGLNVARAKIAAYTLGGVFAAFGGLFIGFQTLSGDPSIGLTYTLNSIAAVVIGGTMLTGGAGSVVGSIAGALVLRTIGSLIFFIGLQPLAQPLFEGAVLLIAVSFGATRLLKIKNRMEVFQ